MAIKHLEKEEIINFIKETFGNKYITNVKGFRKEYPAYYRRTTELFGSVKAAFKEAGIKNSVLQSKFSKEEIANELIRISKIEPISNMSIEKYAIFGAGVVCRHFKSIKNACDELNLPFNEKTHKYVSKEDLNKEIFRLIEKNGYISKPMMESKESKYGPKIVNRIYGNFGNMYEALEIKRHPSGRKPSSEDLIKEFLKIYNKYGTISQDIIENESQYSTTCYKDRFGSFNKLRESLGLPIVKPGESKTADYVIKKVSNFLNETPETEKTFCWLRNPITNHKLRIDAYFPLHKVAVEYNGPQHYIAGTPYCKTEEDLEYRKFLDKVKETILQEHGIKTVWICYSDKVDEEYLKSVFK